MAKREWVTKGRTIVVIAMDLDIANKQVYRSRGVLFVTAGWISETDAISADVKAVWVHPDLFSRFELKYNKKRSKKLHYELRSQQSLESLKAFLDANAQALPDSKPELTHGTRLSDSAIVEQLRSQVAQLQSELQIANAENLRLNAEIETLRTDRDREHDVLRTGT